MIYRACPNFELKYLTDWPASTWSTLQLLLSFETHLLLPSVLFRLTWMFSWVFFQRLLTMTQWHFPTREPRKERRFAQIPAWSENKCLCLAVFFLKHGCTSRRNSQLVVRTQPDLRLRPCTSDGSFEELHFLGLLPEPFWTSWRMDSPGEKEWTLTILSWKGEVFLNPILFCWKMLTAMVLWQKPDMGSIQSRSSFEHQLQRLLFHPGSAQPFCQIQAPKIRVDLSCWLKRAKY